MGNNFTESTERGGTDSVPCPALPESQQGFETSLKVPMRGLVVPNSAILVMFLPQFSKSV